MNEQTKKQAAVKAPRFVRRGPMALAGIREHFTEATMSGIPALWSRFAPLLGAVPGEIEGAAYGVCVRPCEGGSGFDYMAAVEVDGSAATEDLDRLEVPALEYAVFEHVGHVSKVVGTIEGIQREWMPRLRRALAEDDDVPAFLERYGRGFDPVRGRGDIEIWVPVGK
jgi:Uncharacterized protein conserved in bacteria